MNPSELSEEQLYRYEERLGILGVINREPTEQEHEMAMREAMESEL